MTHTRRIPVTHPSPLPAITASVAVLVLGFGVMFIWWSTGRSADDVPSFPDYLSGTIGDGVLLPVLIYGLMRARAHFSAVLSRWQVLIVVAGGLVGATGGALTQVSWYLDPAPKLNWMLPSPHELSLVGWYHGGFLVIMSAVIAALFLDVLVRMRIALRTQPTSLRNDLSSLLSTNATTMIACASALFATTVVIDSARSANSVATWGTVGGILLGILLCGIAIFVTLGRVSALFIRPLIVAAIAVSVLVELVGGPARSNPAAVSWMIAMVCTGVGVAFVGYPGGSVLLSQRLWYTAAPLLCLLIGLVVQRLPADSWPGILAVMLLTIAAASVAMWIYPIREQQVLSLTAAFLTICTVALGATVGALAKDDPDISLTRSLLSGVVPVMLGFVVPRAVQSIWTLLADAERRKRDDHGQVLTEIAATLRRVFIASTGLGLGAFFAAVPLVLIAVDNTVKSTGGERIRIPILLSLLAWAALLLILSLPALRVAFLRSQKSGDSPGKRRPLTGWREQASVAWLAFGAIGSLSVASHSGWYGGASIWVLALVLCISIDTIETIIVNSTLLCMTRPTGRDYVIGVLAGIATGAATYWAVLGAHGQEGLSLGAALGAALAILLVRMATVVAAGSLIYAAKPGWYATDHPPGQNQRLDEHVRSVLLVVVVWLPTYAYTHSTEGRELINVGIMGAVVLPLAAMFLPWSSKELLRHYDDQRSDLRFGGRFAALEPGDGFWLRRCAALISAFLDANRLVRRPDRQEMFIRALGAHLSFLILVRAALVATTLVGLLMMLLTGILAPQVRQSAHTPSPDSD